MCTFKSPSCVPAKRPHVELGIVVNKVGLGCRCWLDLFQHFCAAILHAWLLTVTAQLAERKCFRGVEFADIKGSVQLLISNHLRERDKMLLRAILCRMSGTDSFLAMPRRKMFLAGFVVVKIVMGIFSGNALFTLFSMLVNFPSS